MHTEPSIAWLLLPHQDDEFAAQHWIEAAHAQGFVVRCIFFTKAPNPKRNEQRNHESLSVLARLGVLPHHIDFAGMALDILDGHLQDHLQPLGEWLKSEIAKCAPACIWVPAWEGGHPDHDALHGAVVETAARAHMLDRVRQFPLYNGWKCIGTWFRVMHPLPENGPIDIQQISLRNRWRYLWHCLSYSSQAKSWLGLFPFASIHMIFKGTQFSQGVNRERILNRPHSGPLYYEKRGFSTWEKTEGKICAWIQSL